MQRTCYTSERRCILRRSFALSAFKSQSSRQSIGSCRHLMTIGGPPPFGTEMGDRTTRCRTLLATITVMNTNDAGPGTLRAAIELADVDVTPDTIVFAPSATGTIALSSSALPDLSGKFDIAGPGSSDLTVAQALPGERPTFVSSAFRSVRWSRSQD